ncbi:Rdx family-domain-containing protein [Achaetomium macrosporum]|uniref:Rdx family-domain-containing protein n=1 Tax=Achaetomium macrosporum TaxID=79813 RepID=A0AAN7HFD7_9PEZI|nr:Rdx family-domain-containing protein [Achaetomium macrosporum]
MAETTQGAAEPRLPRITIQFCTQCKWMLRAAYYAQELLSTFSTSLGEVALQPGTGGVFVVEIITTTTTTPNLTGKTTAAPVQPTRTVLWDRKIDGGFPETKELKRRVRDVIQPGRDLGHVDRDYARRGKGDGEEEGKKEGLKEGGVAAGRKEKEGKAIQGHKAEDTEKGDRAGEPRTGRACSVEGQKEEVCEDCQ